MKLKSEYVLRKIGEDHFAVCITPGAAQKMLKLNDTGAFLFEKCQETIDVEALVNALLEEYEVSRELALRDVELFINCLREKQLIDED